MQLVLGWSKKILVESDVATSKLKTFVYSELKNTQLRIWISYACNERLCNMTLRKEFVAKLAFQNE